MTLQESFRLQHDGKDHITQYHEDKRRRDPRLLLDNHLLMGIEKQSFISAEPQWVYEVRKTSASHLFEVTYLAVAGPSDGEFLRPGFAPIGHSGTQYQMALKPLPPEGST
jgi:hypothetical protein